jgi:hypothetical protein
MKAGIPQPRPSSTLASLSNSAAIWPTWASVVAYHKGNACCPEYRHGGTRSVVGVRLDEHAGDCLVDEPLRGGVGGQPQLRAGVIERKEIDVFAFEFEEVAGG